MQELKLKPSSIKKKKILVGMFALLAFTTINAQTKYSMVIQKTDGTEIGIPTKMWNG